jgi:hypothetical protein
MRRGRSQKLRGSIGVGYELTNDLHDNLSEGAVRIIGGGDGGSPTDL